MFPPSLVVPAKAGTRSLHRLIPLWVPAFAGMTRVGNGSFPHPSGRGLQIVLSYIIRLCQPSSGSFIYTVVCGRGDGATYGVLAA